MQDSNSKIMIKNIYNRLQSIEYKEQWLLYLLLNFLFIWKYMSRTAYNPLIGMAVFLVIVISCVSVYQYIVKNNKWVKVSIGILLITACLLIAFFLYYIDSLSVNVDRWSATSYFLDGLFAGEYPYGIHTHVCETNFPSPSPLWFYLNIPFWLMGDVGIHLIFFLCLFIASIFWFTKSYHQTLFLLMLLLISPTYWWEVIVRSDGFSNDILIFAIILFFEKRKFSFEQHWIVTSIICGMMAVTRLWAPIAPAIYLTKSFFKIPHGRKILILAIILLVMFFFFAPYIFWDTDNWIFFKRNPYMSETSTGNGWILLIMIVIALVLAFRYKTFNQYSRYTSNFITLFFLVSLFYNHIAYNLDVSFFEDADFDISYFSFALPYILFTISQGKNCDEKHT